MAIDNSFAVATRSKPQDGVKTRQQAANESDNKKTKKGTKESAKSKVRKQAANESDNKQTKTESKGRVQTETRQQAANGNDKQKAKTVTKGRVLSETRQQSANGNDKQKAKIENKGRVQTETRQQAANGNDKQKAKTVSKGRVQSKTRQQAANGSDKQKAKTVTKGRVLSETRQQAANGSDKQKAKTGTKVRVQPEANQQAANGSDKQKKPKAVSKGKGQPETRVDANNGEDIQKATNQQPAAKPVANAMGQMKALPDSSTRVEVNQVPQTITGTTWEHVIEDEPVRPVNPMSITLNDMSERSDIEAAEVTNRVETTDGSLRQSIAENTDNFAELTVDAGTDANDKNAIGATVAVATVSEQPAIIIVDDAVQIVGAGTEVVNTIEATVATESESPTTEITEDSVQAARAETKMNTVEVAVEFQSEQLPIVITGDSIQAAGAETEVVNAIEATVATVSESSNTVITGNSVQAAGTETEVNTVEVAVEFPLEPQLTAITEDSVQVAEAEGERNKIVDNAQTEIASPLTSASATETVETINDELIDAELAQAMEREIPVDATSSITPALAAAIISGVVEVKAKGDDIVSGVPDIPRIVGEVGAVAAASIPTIASGAANIIGDAAVAGNGGNGWGRFLARQTAYTTLAGLGVAGIYYAKDYITQDYISKNYIKDWWYGSSDLDSVTGNPDKASGVTNKKSPGYVLHYEEDETVKRVHICDNGRDIKACLSQAQKKGLSFPPHLYVSDERGHDVDLTEKLAEYLQPGVNHNLKYQAGSDSDKDVSMCWLAGNRWIRFARQPGVMSEQWHVNVAGITPILQGIGSNCEEMYSDFKERGLKSKKENGLFMSQRYRLVTASGEVVPPEQDGDFKVLAKMPEGLSSGTIKIIRVDQLSSLIYKSPRKVGNTTRAAEVIFDNRSIAKVNNLDEALVSKTPVTIDDQGILHVTFPSLSKAGYVELEVSGVDDNQNQVKSTLISAIHARDENWKKNREGLASQSEE
ncbi:hypothetical protein [Endozoicomonas sp. Mp262]|uniref:hypothetical protein n=1 Tax=Endozoicomonas sp. Mp262 TaxID=2919499 RepID=UPI0021D9874F